MMVQPMRDDLTRLGFVELLTPADVDAALGKTGTLPPDKAILAKAILAKANPSLRQGLP